MEVDFYVNGDPWEQDTWSRISYEIVTRMKERGILRRTFDVDSQRFGILEHLPYLRINRNGIHTVRAHHPRYRHSIEKRAREHARSASPPDAIFALGDLAKFTSAPYFTYQDLDINTVLRWIESSEKTYLFDNISPDLLRQRRECQLDIYQASAGVMVASEWVADSVRDDLGPDTPVKAVGIGHRYDVADPGTARYATRFETPRLLFVGLDGQRKGIDLVVDAFDRVQTSIPDAELTIVTNTDRLNEEVQMACEQSAAITLHGPLPADHLDELYRTHSLFVMPSRFEAWGKVFFEAMSFGLPVVGADRCAMPEFIEDSVNGYTVPLSAAALADRIKAVFARREHYDTLAEHALETAEEYTWERVLNEMQAIIMRGTRGKKH